MPLLFLKILLDLQECRKIRDKKQLSQAKLVPFDIMTMKKKDGQKKIRKANRKR